MSNQIRLSKFGVAMTALKHYLHAEFSENESFFTIEFYPGPTVYIELFPDRPSTARAIGAMRHIAASSRAAGLERAPGPIVFEFAEDVSLDESEDCFIFCRSLRAALNGDEDKAAEQVA